LQTMGFSWYKKLLKIHGIMDYPLVKTNISMVEV
jgi:hypothetical protein